VFRGRGAPDVRTCCAPLALCLHGYYLLGPFHPTPPTNESCIAVALSHLAILVVPFSQPPGRAVAELDSRRAAGSGGPLSGAAQQGQPQGKKKPSGRTNPADSRKERRARGVGTSAAGASPGAWAFADGPSTTRDEDLALVSAPSSCLGQDT